MKYLKTIFLVLLLIIAVLSIGCNKQTNTAPEAIKQEESKEIAPVALNLTMDVAKWNKDSSIKGLTFAYPPELNFQGGGDIDNGSYNFIFGADPKETYFRIFDASLMKCKFEDPAKCNIGTNIPATTQEVYDSSVAGYSTNNPFWKLEGDVKIGNTTGKKFTRAQVSGENEAQAVYIFKSSKGVYFFEDFDLLKGNPDLLPALLSTVEVN